jgi:hypothetical protein
MDKDHKPGDSQQKNNSSWLNYSYVMISKHGFLLQISISVSGHNYLYVCTVLIHALPYVNFITFESSHKYERNWKKDRPKNCASTKRMHVYITFTNCKCDKIQQLLKYSKTLFFTAGLQRAGIAESSRYAVGIATGYGLDDRWDRVQVPIGYSIFNPRYLPDRLWGPPILLSD